MAGAAIAAPAIDVWFQGAGAEDAMQAVDQELPLLTIRISGTHRVPRRHPPRSISAMATSTRRPTGSGSRRGLPMRRAPMASRMPTVISACAARPPREHRPHGAPFSRRRMCPATRRQYGSDRRRTSAIALPGAAGSRQLQSRLRRGPSSPSRSASARPSTPRSTVPTGARSRA